MPKIQAMSLRAQSSEMAGNPQMVQALFAEQQTMHRRLGFKPTSQLWNFAVLPIYIGWFVGLRDFVKNTSLYGLDWVPQSMLWLSDMSHADPYFVVPLIASLISFSSLSTANNITPLPPNSPPNAVLLRKCIPFLAFCFLPILATFPVGISLYFATLFTFNYGLVGLSRNGFMYWLADMKRIIEDDNKYETERAKKFEESMEFIDYPKFKKPPKHE